jgi:exonuclease SbcD
LHLGKRVGEFSMTDDQEDILRKIAALAREHKPDAVLIAGDVYDKATPPVEAVRLLDWFLVRLNELGVAVYLIAGNHDSAERVAFGADLLKRSHVHIAHSYKGPLETAKLEDAHGEVNIWMLPYLKPSLARVWLPNKAIETYSDAVEIALSGAEIDTAKRNVLVAHQFVTGAEISEGSEEISVKTSENIDGRLFDAFDYVALGHIHRPQSVGRETVRYCGTPLKYSFSEINQQKSVTVVDMGKKGTVNISELPLVPSREMRKVRGTYAEIMNRGFYQKMDTDNDYIHIVLTDERDEPDALAKLRQVYKNILSFRYDNKRTQTQEALESVSDLNKSSPAELFGEFFAGRHGRPMSEKQEKYARALFARIREEAGA